MQNKKPVILTFVQYYLPGYKGGGPLRTIANMVDHIGDSFDFKIITRDRDLGDTKPYSKIVVDAWNTIGQASVYYASPGSCSLNRLAKLVSETPHNALYLNSVFDPIFTLWPLLNRALGRIPSRPVMLAARGEFSKGALALNRWKKIPFLAVARMFGFYRNLIWQASSPYEVEDIRQVMGHTAQQIIIAPDLPSLMSGKDAAAMNSSNRTDQLKVVFLSRISPMKNLDFALRVFQQVSVPVQFNIYGPQEDQAYWRQCEALIASLPEHICINYLGQVEHSQVAEIMASHDLFFLPTRGENYGHVIAEALAVGTPVLIADTTPWRDLGQAGVGWDLPLTAEHPYAERINYCAGLDSTTYQAWRNRIRDFASQRLIDPQVIEANRRLFMEAFNSTLSDSSD